MAPGEEFKVIVGEYAKTEKGSSHIKKSGKGRMKPSIVKRLGERKSLVKVNSADEGEEG